MMSHCIYKILYLLWVSMSDRQCRHKSNATESSIWSAKLLIRRFFQPKSIRVFLISRQKHLFIVPIRSTSPRHFCRPQWLSWLRRPTGDQEVAGSTPAKDGNILSWRLIMKYFLRSFSPFRWFKKGSCQFLTKECAQYWLTVKRTKPAQ